MSARLTPYSIGTKRENIDVLLSYKIVELFSKGLYTSPNKALEELVANSFDAGARKVHVLIPSDLQHFKPSDTIAVIDDGEGMDPKELRNHWLIGTSYKRKLKSLPRGRQQIGKFGIGKLATYVLSNRLTHISKHAKKYFSTSIDYRLIDREGESDVVLQKTIKIDMRELTTKEAKIAVGQWSNSPEFKKGAMPLFGKDSPKSWTVTIMSDLKKKAGDIREGRLRWILRTALPMRPDFGVWMAGEKLISSKADQRRIFRWTLGKDAVDLADPALKDITKHTDESGTDEHKFGLKVPVLGRVTGYAEGYLDPLKGKSDDIGRSNGFFVYVRGRLINAEDGHFGISPNELRHGTFSRFRAVIHINDLDEDLLSHREAVGGGDALDTARNLLKAIFNHVRKQIDLHDDQVDSGDKLVNRLAASRASLSRKPIVLLTRSVAEDTARSRHLVVPTHTSVAAREEFLSRLNDRMRSYDKFVTGVDLDYDSALDGPIAKFDTESGVLKLNGYHPFVARFYDDFAYKKSSEPLKLLAMGEVLMEAHLYSVGADMAKIEEFLLDRDQFLRDVADSSQRQSPASVANSLLEAQQPRELEQRTCDAFRSLGFEVTYMGKSNQPDGVAEAILTEGNKYKIVLEAKSKQSPEAKLSASAANISAIIRHMKKHGCTYAAVVAQDFQSSSAKNSAFRQSIRDAQPLKITLIPIRVLAKLVRLRYAKHVVLQDIRALFDECISPEESEKWVESIAKRNVQRPPYRKIIDAMVRQAKEFPDEAIKYPGLRTELNNQTPPIKYSDSELKALCKGMSQMAQGNLLATQERIRLEQSPENVITAIENAVRECDDA